MHLKSLRVFCDVVGRRSFSRAASENGITQSGASQIVHHLEEHLGVKLIDRSKRPFVLTPEGEVYYEGCRGLVQRLYALEDEVRSLRQEVEGRVSVASIYSIGLSHMNRCVQDFLHKHPKAHVRVEYQHPQQVVELVESGQVDLGLISYPKQTRTLKAIPWRDEAMVVVCAPTHPLAGAKSVTLEQLDGREMVGFDEGLQIRREIDRVLSARGVSVHVVMEFDNIETLKLAVEINAGLSVLPGPWLRGKWSSDRWWRFPWPTSRWCDRWASSTGAGSILAPRLAVSFSSCWTIPRRTSGPETSRLMLRSRKEHRRVVWMRAERSTCPRDRCSRAGVT